MPTIRTLQRSILAVAALAGLACVRAASADPAFQTVVAHARAHPAGDVPASFVPADYAGDLRDLPIGVFDSGIGGLTVFEAIKAYDARNNNTGKPGADGVPDFAHERFIYFGDQANMPYGNYPAAGRTDFLRELALKDVLFLLGHRYQSSPGGPARTDKPRVKAIVIACNTATAYALEDIRAAVKAWGVPVFVVGVVEAGARGLAETRASATGSIAVLATVGTCASDAYPKAIAQAQPAGITWPVWQRGSVTLAAAIEGDASVKEPIAEIIRREVRALLENRRTGPAGPPIDTVVLGCTHYPLVRDGILQAFTEWRDYTDAAGTRPYAALLAPALQVIDPASWTAEDLWRSLDRAGLWSHARAPAGDLFFLSVANPTWPGVQLDEDGGLRKSYKYGRNAGALDCEDTVIVPLTPASLPASSAKLVRERLPWTWAALQAASR